MCSLYYTEVVQIEGKAGETLEVVVLLKNDYGVDLKHD